MKKLLKKIIRPFYYFVINAKTKIPLVLKAKIVKSFLPKAYRDELTFFEDIRSQTYKDAEYLSKRIRLLTHQVDKTFTLSKKVNRATTAAQVGAWLKDFPVQTESDRITREWAEEILSHYNAHEKGKQAERPVLPREAAEIVSAAIRTRRSVRSYQTGGVDEAQLKEILESGLWAPSGCNRQPVEYLVVDSEEDVLFCQKYAGEFFTFPREAAFNVVVLIDPRGYALPHQRHMAYLEGGAAIQNILLSAHSLGLGSCWMFWSKHDEAFNTRFGLEPWLLPVGLVCIGRTDRQPPIVPKRKCVLDCIHDMRKKD